MRRNVTPNGTHRIGEIVEVLWFQVHNGPEAVYANDITELRIRYDDWQGMEEPAKVTVTIVPGDQLNKETT